MERFLDTAGILIIENPVLTYTLETTTTPLWSCLDSNIYAQLRLFSNKHLVHIYNI